MKNFKEFGLFFLVLFSCSLVAMQDSIFPDDFDEEVVDVDTEFINEDSDSLNDLLAEPGDVLKQAEETDVADDLQALEEDQVFSDDFDEGVVDIEIEPIKLNDDNVVFDSMELDGETQGSVNNDKIDSEIVLSEIEEEPAGSQEPDNRDSEENEKKVPEIETVNLPEEKIGIQGNWIKKREWVKESYKVNQKIQNIVSEIQKLRSPFKDKFTKIDNELDLFYKQESLNQGSAKTLFSGVNRYLDKKKKKYSRRLQEGVTPEDEIELETLLRDTKILKKELKQLMLDVQSVDQIDKSLADRLKKLDEYLKMALDESINAKEMADEVWYIIDDLKARDIYYKLKGDSLEKVNAIKKYLIGSFESDFNNLLSTIRDQFIKISEHIKDLEKRGLIIKDRAERLEEIKFKKDNDKDNDLPNNIEKPQDLTIIQKIYRYSVDIIAKIHNFLSEM
jgi:hypothetical protein